MATASPDCGQAEASVGCEARPPITVPYMLFVCAPLEIDEQGGRWTAASWAKDLALHLDYLTDLTLVSPATHTTGRSPKLVSLNEPPFDRLKYIDLPCPTSRRDALKTLPSHVRQYWRAIDRGRIIHPGSRAGRSTRACSPSRPPNFAGDSLWPTSNPHSGGLPVPSRGAGDYKALCMSSSPGSAFAWGTLGCSHRKPICKKQCRAVLLGLM
jgi:hypothetical protein